MINQVDELYEDEPISGQQYSIVSIIGPDAPQKCGKWAVKIRGVAADMDKAKKIVKKIYEQDSSVNIHVVETGKFFPVGFSAQEIKGEVMYGDTTLESIVNGEARNKDAKKREWERDLETRRLATERDAKEGVKNDALTKLVSIGTVTREIDSLTSRLKESKEKLEVYNSDLESHSAQEIESAREQFSKM